MHAIVNIAKEIATFFGYEACVMASSGYLACMSAVQAVCDRNTIILMDQKCHDCLRTGALISRGKIVKFSHNNIVDAYNKTKHLKNADIVIVVESIYSMDATVFDLPRIKTLKEDLLRRNNKVLLISDESHAIGNLGATGRGGEEFYGLEGQGVVDIMCTTCSKAISVCGGVICASKALMDRMLLRASSFIFTCNINGYCARLIQAGFRTLDEEGRKGDASSIRNAQRLSEKFKRLMHAEGIEIGHLLDYKSLRISLSPVIVGSVPRMTYLVRKILQDDSYLMFGSAFPVCPIGRALFRVAIRGDMKDNDITRMANMLIKHIHATPDTLTYPELVAREKQKND